MCVCFSLLLVLFLSLSLLLIYIFMVVGRNGGVYDSGKQGFGIKARGCVELGES